MTVNEALFNYSLRLGDNSLILSHRLSEWTGKAPILEEDLAITNIALDKLGQARFLLQYAAQLEGKGRSEDDLAYKRSEREFYNSLLVEQPNGDFAFTMARQLLNDVFDFFLYEELTKSTNEPLASLAAKSLKEIKYHLRHCSEWIIRLGDGTEESHNRIQNSMNELWAYTGELFEMNEIDSILIKENMVPDLSKLKPKWNNMLCEIFEKATLKKPEEGFMHTGSRKGVHSEYLGFILAEMQYLPRAYPSATW
ncbi:MAG: phenylacetate-CoA oxygenase subunit PaaC [Flavobacteriales bacterium]|nr:phenylacetate-CoA oxygenase subunit PaaC [Flavobacteriales bacterium]